MNIRELKAVVKCGESDVVEFKASTGQLNRAVETLCAFLNKKGGMLLLGVTDDGEIIGEKVTDNTKRDIANQLNRIEPHPDIETVFLPIGKGKEIVVLIAKPGSNGPYVCNGRPYVRVQSTTKIMPQEEYKRILRAQSPKIVWEDLVTNKCTIDDLDENRIRQIVRIAIAEKRMPEIAAHANIKEILTKFELLIDDQCTNAAVVLFCKDEYKQFMQSSLKLARFDGINKRDFIDNKDIRGNAFDLYESAIAFLRNYLPIAGKIEEGNPFRIDTPAIPYKVLREAIVNALCHRDYSFGGGSVDIAIYDDRVEIVSSGALPDEIELSDLTKQHKSRPRNPHIAHVFFLCRMIERWGRGTLDMVEICQEAGNPIPRFEETKGSFSVIFPLKEPIKLDKLQPSIFQLLSNRQKEILKILKYGPMSRKQVMEKMSSPLTDRIIQMDLLALKKLQLIVQKGKSRSIVWTLANL